MDVRGWVEKLFQRNAKCDSLKDPRAFTYGMIRHKQGKRGVVINNLPVTLHFNIFYYALRVSWLQLFFAVVVLYMFVSLIFSALYVMASCNEQIEFGMVRPFTRLR